MGVLTLCRLHGLSTGQETGTRFRKRHTLIMHAYTRLSCLDASEAKVRPRRRRRLMRSGWVTRGIIVKCTCIMCVCVCVRELRCRQGVFAESSCKVERGNPADRMMYQQKNRRSIRCCWRRPRRTGTRGCVTHCFTVSVLCMR